MASERLDLALRRAFWAESRPIHNHHEILTIAGTVDGLDVEALEHDLRDGVARADVFADEVIAASDAVVMSPHLFLADGTDHPNPGITVHWQGDWAKGFPVIDHDDPSVVGDLLDRASAHPPLQR